MHIWKLNLVNIVPVDGLASNGAKPLAGTLLVTALDIPDFSS